MSTQSKIIESIVSTVKKIREGNKIPGLPEGSSERYAISVNTVERSLSNDLAKDKYPALFVTNPSVYYRHLLSDVSICTMRFYVAGVLYNYSQTSTKDVGSVVRNDRLREAVHLTLTANSTWGDNAIRGRVLSCDVYTETEEEGSGFVFTCEADFIEYSDSVPDKDNLLPLPVDVTVCGSSRLEILNALYNCFLDTENISHVERATTWPVPPEIIFQKNCPGIWFRDSQEYYNYLGSRQADKNVAVNVLYAAVDFDAGTFANSVDVHVARIKDVLGRHADLEDRVLTVDIRAIRTNRSEYPVILLDVELAVRYIQSWEES